MIKLKLFLPLKFCSRFFLCSGLKSGSMVVVFSHCPSSVFTLNVKVLPITTENKIKTESRRIPSSIPENFKTVFLLILVFIFLKFKRNKWQTSVWSGFTFIIASLVMELKGPLLVWFRANEMKMRPPVLSDQQQRYRKL